MGIDGSTIKFEDVSYTDRLKQHDLMALHYRRFLILICGLDHRLKLFGDFYDTNTPYSFLSLEFRERYFQFLHDKDGSGLLGMAETRPSLQSYLEQANSCLQSDPGNVQLGFVDEPSDSTGEQFRKTTATLAINGLGEPIKTMSRLLHSVRETISVSTQQ